MRAPERVETERLLARRPRADDAAATCARHAPDPFDKRHGPVARWAPSGDGMQATAIVQQLRALGSESYRKVLRAHGVPGPCFGVKIEELKKLQRRIKKDYRLALELYGTGVYDAMCLAGLVADDLAMTPDDLRLWAERATCSGLSDYTVAWVAAESRHGWDLAREWIDSEREHLAACGWSTLRSLVAIRADAELDLGELRRLLERVRKTIHGQPDRVRYAMNGFVIALGCHVAALTDRVLEAAARIGKVEVDMGGTACKVPSARDYIEKFRARGALGKKRKTAKC